MSTANPLKRKSHQEATNAAPSAKKVKTPTPPAAVVSPPTPAAAVPAAGDSEAMEDVVSGNRKKRAHGTAKKKRAGRVSKHILDAAARKEAAAIAAAGEAEEKAIAQPAASGAASLASIAKAKVPPPKFSKATPAAAPTPVAVVESKVLALEYLRQWSNERAGWKFQKVRQQWLLDHVYEKDLLGKNDFATLCEYIKELKGAARTVSRHAHAHFAAAASSLLSGALATTPTTRFVK